MTTAEYIQALRAALEWYADYEDLQVPADWNYAKMGGAPDVEQLERTDIGATAREALALPVPEQVAPLSDAELDSMARERTSELFYRDEPQENYDEEALSCHKCRTAGYIDGYRACERRLLGGK